MRLLIDTDVLLHVLMAREPHVEASSNVLDWAKEIPVQPLLLGIVLLIFII